jgi:hypothetical protein
MQNMFILSIYPKSFKNMPQAHQESYCSIYLQALLPFIKKEMVLPVKSEESEGCTGRAKENYNRICQNICLILQPPLGCKLFFQNTYFKQQSLLQNKSNSN